MASKPVPKIGNGISLQEEKFWSRFGNILKTIFWSRYLNMYLIVLVVWICMTDKETFDDDDKCILFIHLRVSAFDNKKYSTASDFWQVFMYFLRWMWQNVRIEEWHSIVLLGGKCLKATLEKYFCAISLPVLLLFAHPSKKINFPPIMWPFFSPPLKSATEKWNHGHCQNCV